MTPIDVASFRKDGTLVVVPEGELDIATVGAVRSAVAERAPQEHLTLDLRHLTFLDTSGIQLVVEAFRAARDERFRLRLLRARPQVQRVFEIAGLESVLPFEDGDDGA